MNVKVLGTGCPNCKRLEKMVVEAIADLGIDATVTKVTDINEIMDFNILSTPGLAIDDLVVSSGRIPSKAEIVAWLKTSVAS